MAFLTLVFTRSIELKTHEAVGPSGLQSANWPREDQCQRSHAHGFYYKTVQVCTDTILWLQTLSPNAFLRKVMFDFDWNSTGFCSCGWIIEDISLPELIMTQFDDAYMRQGDSVLSVKTNIIASCVHEIFCQQMYVSKFDQLYLHDCGTRNQSINISSKHVNLNANLSWDDFKFNIYSWTWNASWWSSTKYDDLVLRFRKSVDIGLFRAGRIDILPADAILYKLSRVTISTKFFLPFRWNISLNLRREKIKSCVFLVTWNDSALNWAHVNVSRYIRLDYYNLNSNVMGTFLIA